MTPAERSRKYRLRLKEKMNEAGEGEPLPLPVPAPAPAPAVPSSLGVVGGKRKREEELKFPEFTVVHRDNKTIITIVIRD